MKAQHAATEDAGHICLKGLTCIPLHTSSAAAALKLAVSERCV